MEIIKQIANLKKTIEVTDQLVDELISTLESQRLKSEKKDEKIKILKEEVKLNIEKIDEIIEEYNANT